MGLKYGIILMDEKEPIKKERILFYFLWYVIKEYKKYKKYYYIVKLKNIDSNVGIRKKM